MLFSCQKKFNFILSIIKSKISIVEKYVRDILQQHDLSVARNSTNKKNFNNIVDKCMDDLKNTELRDQFDNDNQVKYFVRQSILYLIVK